MEGGEGDGRVGGDFGREEYGMWLMRGVGYWGKDLGGGMSR